jgi:hypothetical protein
MPLHLQSTGIAVSFATVGVGDVEDECANARKALDSADPKTKAAILGEPEILFLLGQADVATVFETNDFRRIFGLRYPRGESNALAVNWVFSVPYDLPELPADSAATEGDRLRFVLLLRLRRPVYAYDEAEQKIVERLAMLLDQNRTGARIHAGVGWSDLVIDGHFTRKTFDDLVRFIIAVNNLRFEIGKPRTRLPVVQRMLTVMGYSGKPPRFGDSNHLTFLRVVPGGYDPILAKLLEEYGEVSILDGKADFMVFPKADLPDNWLVAQRRLGSRRHRHRLQKVETHLMFRRATDHMHADADARLVISVHGSVRHRRTCRCANESAKWLGLLTKSLDRMDTHLLPAEERHALDNILFLLGATLRDQSICCDVREAVRGCYYGLLTILDAIDELSAGMPARLLQCKTVEEQLLQHQSYWHELASRWRDAHNWHDYTDLLLRQRTVGSYEEILGQTDRSVVHSGGVQKILYVADRLTKDFAEKVYRGRPFSPDPFPTVYDSVKTILSTRGGPLRIPTRNIFALPVAVPDLWHEVGVNAFFSWYAEEVTKRVPANESSEFLANLADHFGDLLVYFHGFAGHFDKFLLSLAYVCRASYGDQHAMRDVIVPQFLARVYLVFELHKVREAIQNNDKAWLTQFAASPEATATDLIDELKPLFRTSLLPRYAPFLDIEPAHWTNLWPTVTNHTFSDFQRALYLPLLREPLSTPVVSLKAFEAGALKAFEDDDDLNAYFAQLAYYIQAQNRDQDLPLFQMMASLAKSAVNEYHRRQIQEDRRYRGGRGG